jgi:hypothetical protein
MAGLGVTFDEIRSEVGFMLGFGRDTSAWDASAPGLTAAARTERSAKLASIDSAIKGGLRKFLFGSLCPGTRKVYEWSFLRKWFDFTTAESVGDYPLPADFGSPEGDVLFPDDGYSPVPALNEARLLELRSRDDDSSGTPQYYATRHRPSSAAAGQGQDLLLWPLPSGAWRMRLCYQVTGEMLDDARQHPPGGPQHSRTVLYCCLAEAAKRIGPNDPTYEGEYQQALAASISVDSRTRPANLGYAADGERHEGWGRNSEFTVSVNGTLYEGD